MVRVTRPTSPVPVPVFRWRVWARRCRLGFGRRRVAGSGSGDAGDGQGVPGAGGDDDPPFGAGVGGGDRGELAGLGGGDRPDPAEVTGRGAGSGECFPGQGYVQQPGGRPPVGRSGGGAGERGRDGLGQVRPVAGGHLAGPAVGVIVVAVTTVRAVVGAGVVVLGPGCVLVPGRRHILGRHVIGRQVIGSAAGVLTVTAGVLTVVTGVVGSAGVVVGVAGRVAAVRVAGGWVVGWGGLGGGAEEQGDVDLGAEQVQGAISAVGLLGAGHGLDPGHGRGGVDDRHPLPGQCRGLVLVGVQHHPRAPLGVLAPCLGAGGVDGQDGAAQRGAQHPGGLAPGGGQHPGLDRPRMILRTAGWWPR